MCCWKCELCNSWMYLENEVTCTDCGLGRWPYDDRRGCYDLDIQYMRWDSLLALVPVCVACLGILLAVTVITIFIRHSETPIVKVRWISYSFHFYNRYFSYAIMNWYKLVNDTDTMSQAINHYFIKYSKLLFSSNYLHWRQSHSRYENALKQNSYRL